MGCRRHCWRDQRCDCTDRLLVGAAVEITRPALHPRTLDPRSASRRHVTTTPSTTMDPLAAVNAGWADPSATAASPASPTTPRTSSMASPASPTAQQQAARAANAGGAQAPHHPASHLSREPHVYGDPGTTLMHPGGASSATGEQGAPPAPFLRVRIGVLERNRKDLLIRYDASVSCSGWAQSVCAGSGERGRAILQECVL